MNDKKQISAFEADWRKAAWVKSVRQRREQAERRADRRQERASDRHEKAWFEAELFEDAITPPAKCSAEEGIRSMQARIRFLRAEIRRVLRWTDPEKTAGMRRQILPRLAEAQRRLAD